MKFLGEWIATTIGFFILLYVIFFVVSFIGVAFDTRDLLSYEGPLIILGISAVVSPIFVLAAAQEPRPPFELTERELFLWQLAVEQLIKHRDRILASNHPDHSFVLAHLSGPKIGEIAGHLAKKMALTEDDGKAHSALIGDKHLCVEVLTLRESISGACDWIEQNHGGYVGMLDRLLPLASDTGAQAFCQITFGMKTREGRDVWLNMGLMPLDGTVFKSHPVVPTDLLSPSDLEQVGGKLIRAS